MSEYPNPGLIAAQRQLLADHWHDDARKVQAELEMSDSQWKEFVAELDDEGLDWTDVMPGA